MSEIIHLYAVARNNALLLHPRAMLSGTILQVPEIIFMLISREQEGVAKGENKGVVGWLMCNLALYQPNIFAKMLG